MQPIIDVPAPFWIALICAVLMIGVSLAMCIFHWALMFRHRTKYYRAMNEIMEAEKKEAKEKQQGKLTLAERARAFAKAKKAAA